MPEVALGAMLRGLRRAADLSQRQLATRAGVSQPLLARIESGAATNPRFRTVERLVRAAGGRLDADAVGVTPIPHENLRDGGDRHYAAHLDVREVLRPEDWSGAWWADTCTFPRTRPKDRWPFAVPDLTFDANRVWRDRRRVEDEARRRATVRQVVDGVPEAALQWVAEMPDGEVIGELRAVRRGNEIDVVRVAVVRSRRNAGIGRRLVDALLAEAEAVGVRRLRAATDGQGSGFLWRCGFRAAGELRLFVRDSR